MDSKEIGQICYEAYANAKQWNLDGERMWSWERPDFPEDEREAWRHAAREVIRKGWQDTAPAPRQVHTGARPTFTPTEGHHRRRLRFLPFIGLGRPLRHPPRPRAPPRPALSTLAAACLPASGQMYFQPVPCLNAAIFLPHPFSGQNFSGALSIFPVPCCPAAGRAKPGAGLGCLESLAAVLAGIRVLALALAPPGPDALLAVLRVLPCLLHALVLPLPVPWSSPEPLAQLAALLAVQFSFISTSSGAARGADWRSRSRRGLRARPRGRSRRGNTHACPRCCRTRRRRAYGSSACSSASVTTWSNHVTASMSSSDAE